MLETRFISCTIEYSRYFRRSIFAVMHIVKTLKRKLMTALEKKILY